MLPGSEKTANGTMGLVSRGKEVTIQSGRIGQLGTAHLWSGRALHFCPFRGRTMERKGTTVMKRFLAAHAGSMLLLLSLAGVQARADFIAAWSYDWSRTPSTGVIAADPGGTGGLTL